MGKDRITFLYEVIKKLNSLCATLSGVVLLFITFSIFIDVILRYFFNRPSIWITEVSTYLFLYMIFLGTAYALQEGLHIRVTFFYVLFGTRAKRFIDLATSLFAMTFSLTLLWQTSVMTWTAFKDNWTSPTMLNAPYAYIYVAMVLGSFFLFLTFLFETVIQFRESYPGHSLEESK